MAEGARARVCPNRDYCPVLINGAKIVAWLRNLRRGAKFTVLLVAAWCPFLFSQHPIIMLALMASATGLFVVTTSTKRPSDLRR
jgi:hypothetical protein